MPSVFPALAFARAFAGQSPVGDCFLRLTPPAPPFLYPERSSPGGIPGRSLTLAAFVAQNGPLDRFVAFGDRSSPLRHRQTNLALQALVLAFGKPGIGMPEYPKKTCLPITLWAGTVCPLRAKADMRLIMTDAENS